MGKAKKLGYNKPVQDPRQQQRFKKGKPNNSRCPKCGAKLKRRGFAISCNRCGYSKCEEEDKMTKAFYYWDYARF